MRMDKPKACTNCRTRLHPLEVSDLHRGKKLDCHVCGYQLRAVATGAWASVTAVLVGMLPWLSSWVLRQDGFIAEMLIIIAIAAGAWLAPPGLIAGAPWVRIKAEEPARGGIKLHWENIRRQQRQGSDPGFG